MSRSVPGRPLRRRLPLLLAGALLTTVVGGSPAWAEVARTADPTPVVMSPSTGPELPGVAPDPVLAGAQPVDGAGGVVARQVTNAQVHEVTDELNAGPGVVRVAADTPASTTDPDRSAQWALDDLELDTLPAGTPDGSGALVAVLDTGVLAQHEDLRGRVRCDLGADFATDAGTTDPAGDGCVDPNGRGTYVAGVISAVAGNGVGIEGASSAPIMPVRVLATDGSGTAATVSQGIRYAVDHGASVITISLAGQDDPAYDAAVQYATGHGVVLVAAAGDDRSQGNSANYPAATPGVIAVAATDVYRNPAYFSHSGPTNVIAAPGRDVVSISPPDTFLFAGGTSVAAGYVAAVLARYRQGNPSATPAQVRDALVGTAVDIGPVGRDDDTGYGLVNPVTLLTGQPPALRAPGAPVLEQVVAGYGSATVSWRAPTDLGSPAVTSYEVTVHEGPSPLTGTWTQAPASSLTVTGLSPGSSYTFTVRAINAVGYTGPESAHSPAVTLSDPIGDLWRAWGGSAGRLGEPAGPVVCGLRNDGCRRSFDHGVVYASPSTGAHEMDGDILTAWNWIGWGEGRYGYPVSDARCGLAGGGCLQQFESGSIYWSPATGAHQIDGDILAEWGTLGWEFGRYGYPVADARCGLAGGGCLQQFQGGSIYWSPATGAHAVDGDILAEWGTLGWEFGRYGYPVTDAQCGGATGGCLQQFQGGSITWTPGAGPGAHAVDGDILAEWRTLGGQYGRYGYPLYDASCGLAGGGCGQMFRGGWIYWSPSAGAHAVDGEIYNRWRQLGFEDGRYGYPVTSARCGLAGGGCLQQFQGGSIYWSTASGAHAIDGAIRDRWGTLGWEFGRYGYPRTEARCGLVAGGCLQQFQQGSIYWSPATGAVPVDGGILTYWGRLGYENGTLGYPVSPAVVLPSGDAVQRFQGGSLTWSASSHLVRVS